ncbi:MAG: hypothetical protein Q4F56_03335, partial [Candidatus Saccharibacteria bacterium]|nr:hypothetical protein [Candidatus Saccharibacteria bacterium]
MEIIRNNEPSNSGDIISKDDISPMGEVDFVDSASTEQRVITKIKSAVKDQHRVNIYINGKFSFSLDIA